MASVVILKKSLLTTGGKFGPHNIIKLLGAFSYQKRDSSVNLAKYKRGRGGRSSFSGVVATVFGASGALGRHVVNKLGQCGSQVIVPYRRDACTVDHLKLCGDLGQVLFSPFNLKDEESLVKAMKYSNVVINLIGRHWETKNFSFDDVHCHGAARIARLARECGVQKLIHVSSLNASPKPPEILIKGGSKFLKSKYKGELAVREEFPDATIIRPSDMFGPHDYFYKMYVRPERSYFDYVPLWESGTKTIKQPVFVADVAEGIFQAVFTPEAVGKTYEAVGASRYYLADLVDYFLAVVRRDHSTRIPFVYPYWLQVKFMEMMSPNNPIVSTDKLERDHLTDTTTGLPTLEDLGLTEFTRIEERVVFDLFKWRKNSDYNERLGEFKEPTLPPIVIDTPVL